MHQYTGSPCLRPCSLAWTMRPFAKTRALLPVLCGTSRILSTHALAKPPRIDEAHIPCFPSERIIQFFPRAVFIISCKFALRSAARAFRQLGKSNNIAALITHKDAVHLLLPETPIHVRQDDWTPKAHGRPLQNHFTLDADFLLPVLPAVTEGVGGFP